MGGLGGLGYGLRHPCHEWEGSQKGLKRPSACANLFLSTPSCGLAAVCACHLIQWGKKKWRENKHGTAQAQGAPGLGVMREHGAYLWSPWAQVHISLCKVWEAKCIGLDSGCTSWINCSMSPKTLIHLDTGNAEWQSCQQKGCAKCMKSQCAKIQFESVHFCARPAYALSMSLCPYLCPQYHPENPHLQILAPDTNTSLHLTQHYTIGFV